MSINDELAEILAKNLNKENKEQKVAFFLDGDEDAPTNVKDWISTGSSMLDLAIANKPHGGIPVGRITEISGLEQTGKSLICAHILAETQKRGGVGVMIDTESSVSREFFEAVGVDVKRLVWVQAETVEDIFAAIESIIKTVRESDKDKIVTITVDSIAGVSTKKELAGDWDKDGYATDKAIIISKAMRKITNTIARQKIALVFTNQLRQKMGVMFGDPWVTSGGKSLQFHSSVRIRLTKLSTIKKRERKVERIIGVKVRALCMKNRLGPPLRTADFDVFYDSGIDNYGGWLTTMKNEELVKQEGAWYTYNDGKEDHKFQAKNFPELVETNTELRENIYNNICNTVIMKYKREKHSVDEIEYDEDNDGTDS